jgi:tRNA (Thr-GGU) A37 N-methylase
VARDGLRIEVDALETVDGTPVVDVKPPSTRSNDALRAAEAAPLVSWVRA